ncbi:MAG: hypothetical protein EXS35_05135 [Pedosphaera sp.]|nr:hypothetical protein [Pedosphaera sp.]
MNDTNQPRKSRWWSAEFFSAKDFCRHGVLILLAFAGIHLLGLRESTSVLNGTTGAVNMNPDNAVLLGVLYVLLYLAAILLVPIFFITAGLLMLWEKFLASRRTPT